MIRLGSNYSNGSYKGGGGWKLTAGDMGWQTLGSLPALEVTLVLFYTSPRSSQLSATPNLPTVALFSVAGVTADLQRDIWNKLRLLIKHL